MKEERADGGRSSFEHGIRPTGVTGDHHGVRCDPHGLDVVDGKQLCGEQARESTVGGGLVGRRVAGAILAGDASIGVEDRSVPNDRRAYFDPLSHFRLLRATLELRRILRRRGACPKAVVVVRAPVDQSSVVPAVIDPTEWSFMMFVDAD